MEQMEHKLSWSEMDFPGILLANLSDEDTVEKPRFGWTGHDFKEDYARILKRLLYY